MCQQCHTHHSLCQWAKSVRETAFCVPKKLWKSISPPFQKIKDSLRSQDCSRNRTRTLNSLILSGNGLHADLSQTCNTKKRATKNDQILTLESVADNIPTQTYGPLVAAGRPLVTITAAEAG